MTPKMIFNGNETALNESGIIENVYIESKIIKIGQCDEEICPSQCAAGRGGHLGGHLGF